VPILFHDFETRSTLNLKRVGAPVYAMHSTTDVWCCAYAVDDGEVKIWKPGDPVPEEFIEAARNLQRVTCAHNDEFERLITTHIMAPRYGWPIVPIERRRCSMAMALALALPGKLEKVAEALNLTNRKDAAGHKLMLKMARPRKPRIDEDPAGVYWLDDPERLEKLYSYCKQDNIVERELHHRLRPLIPEEQARWQYDIGVNDRGFGCDRTLAAAMVKIADTTKQAIDAELEKITAGAVTGVAQNDKLIAWLTAHGCPVDDIQKGTLSHAMRRKNLAPEVYRVMELRRAGAHAAAAKPLAFIDRCGEDNRIRGAFTFHGTSTGRWSSLGIQVQNLKRPDGLEDVAGALEAVLTSNLDRIRKYGEPLAVIGAVVRALITAAPGCRLVAADFSGIESRINAWLSGETWKTEQWAKFDRTKDPNDEPYLIIGRMLGIPEEKARQIGKVADLAFGFMGGLPGWRKFAAMYGLEEKTDEEIRALQQAWRKAHPNIVRFWSALNRAAILATKNPGKIMAAGPRISFRHEGEFLFMRLPSGRELAYPFATLKTTDRGDLAVTFMDIQKGKWGPCRFGHGAYGGLWVENAVSATARDVFAEAMPRLEAAGYPVVFHVHDEIVAEVPDGFGSVEDFEKIIVEAPVWADGMAIAAKGRNGPRFLKTGTPKAAPVSYDRKPTPEVELKPELAKIPAEETPESPPWDPIPPKSGVAMDPEPKRPNGNGQDYHESRTDSRGHGEQEYGHKADEFIYLDQFGQPYLKVTKYVAVGGKKQFPQYHLENGKWVKNPPAGPRIPYNLPALIKAGQSIPICFTEGEKDSDTLIRLGFVATTNPEGAGKIQPELIPWFQNRETVYLFEDNDAAGLEHVAKIAAALKDAVRDIFVVRFPDVPAGEDVTYWLDDLGHTKDDLLERMKAAPKVEPKAAKRFVLVCAADVVAKPMDWLWQDHLARGSLEMMTGLPGEGKSQVQCQYVTCATTGRAWPNGRNGVSPGRAIMLTAEDNLAQIVKPRLLAAGADCTRVHFLPLIRKDKKERMFLLAEDLELLEEAIVELGDVAIVTVDPITAFMGGGKNFDSHRATDVRSQLGPLSAMAERTNVVFSAVTHPPKSAGQRALDHFLGSQAFIAAARLGHLCVAEMEDDGSGQRQRTGRTLFCSAKYNVIDRRTPAIAYRIEKALATPEIEITRVAWEETIDITADEALAAATPPKERKGDAAVTFLQDMLTSGPGLVEIIQNAPFHPSKGARVSTKPLILLEGWKGAKSVFKGKYCGPGPRAARSGRRARSRVGDR
jgi:DNA polymerase bacteriophage-type